MRPTLIGIIVAANLGAAVQPRPARTPYVMENLGRGVVAVRTGDTSVYIGWRLLGTDLDDIAFNLYRAAGAAAPIKINRAPIVATTDFVDTTASPGQSHTYTVRPVRRGTEQAAAAPFTLPADAPIHPFLTAPLDRPPGGTVAGPPGSPTSNFTYSPNDASVADLDGDGEYEIVLKWDPSNARDTASAGLSGSVLLDGYRRDGTRLWRIDLGRNIRAGAHYTQFIVYDLDGDGRAEVACKTADGSVDGQGRAWCSAGRRRT